MRASENNTAIVPGTILVKNPGLGILGLGSSWQYYPSEFVHILNRWGILGKKRPYAAINPAPGDVIVVLDVLELSSEFITTPQAVVIFWHAPSQKISFFSGFVEDLVSTMNVYSARA